MEITPLPEHPDSELLKKRAKELLRAVRAGDAGSAERLRGAVPRLRRIDARALASEARLADAQHAIARGHGFASWTALLRHLESLGTSAEHAARLLLAVREHDA